MKKYNKLTTIIQPHCLSFYNNPTNFPTFCFSFSFSFFKILGRFVDQKCQQCSVQFSPAEEQSRSDQAILQRSTTLVQTITWWMRKVVFKGNRQRYIGLSNDIRKEKGMHYCSPQVLHMSVSIISSRFQPMAVPQQMWRDKYHPLPRFQTR